MYKIRGGNYEMGEKIIPVDLVEQHNTDMIEYSTYVALKRAIPDLRDGLKSVHRRILYTMYSDLHKYPNTPYVKSARVVGSVMGLYHPHGDSSIYDAMKPMTNDFEIKVPYLDGNGAWGNPLGLKAAAPRYTETKLSEYGYDCIIGDLKQSSNAVDYEDNYSGETQEPIYLPSAVPNLLINGCKAIGSGTSVSIPRHNFNEVIDATIALMHNPSLDIILVPDNCMPTEIIDTDWVTISHTGRGKFRVRGIAEICEYENKSAICIRSVPDLVFFDSISDAIEKMMLANKLPQIDKVVDKCEKNKMEIYIVLKKGSDPNFVRDMLYTSTNLEAGIGVNFEVLVPTPESRNIPIPKLVSYKEYLLDWIEFRKLTKFRIYCNQIRDIRTKYHQMELYIKALESGEIDNIIKMIRKQKGTDDSLYIEYMIKKIKGITDVQAKFLLNTDIRKLSKGYLDYYKQKRDEYLSKYNIIFKLINDDNLILGEIESELLEFKKKYGKPRMSKIISKEEALNIPKGTFQIIITNGNCIKKTEIGANTTGLGGDYPIAVFNADNADSILLFGSHGKVFRLPIAAIPFTLMDIRKLLKNLTSDINSIILESSLKDFSHGKYNFVYTLTQNGYIKRMSCEEFFNVPASGLIYIKLEEMDIVKDVIFADCRQDIFLYAGNKALRIRGNDTPHLMRSTKGNISMSTNSPMLGFNALDKSTTGIVVLSNNGYVNHVSLSALPLCKRARAGVTMIKLKKGDTVYKMFDCKDEDIIRIYTGRAVQEVQVGSIPYGASTSSGKKMFPNMDRAEIVRV